MTHNIVAPVNISPKSQMFIGGQFKDANSGRTMNSINPATSELLTTYPLGDASDVEDAVIAAEKIRLSFNVR